MRKAGTIPARGLVLTPGPQGEERWRQGGCQVGWEPETGDSQEEGGQAWPQVSGGHDGKADSIPATLKRGVEYRAEGDAWYVVVTVNLYSDERI